MRKIFLFFMLIFTLSLCSCDFSFLQYQGDSQTDDKEDETDNNNEQNKNDDPENGETKDEYEIVDIVVEGTTDAVGYLNVSYAAEGIKVYAVDEEGTRTEVTKFSTITADTSSLGASVAIVKYEEYTKQYAITVLSDRVKALTANLKNVNLNYTAGDTLNLSNMILSVEYHGGAKKNVYDYTYTLTLNGTEVQSLVVAGEYIVKVTYIDEINIQHSISFVVFVTDPSGATTHTHSYTSTTVAPTCTEDGYDLYSCVCGDSFTSSPTSKLGHNYIKVSCTNCSDNLPDLSVTPVVTYLSPTTARVSVEMVGQNQEGYSVNIINYYNNDTIPMTSANAEVNLQAGGRYNVLGGYYTMNNGVKTYVYVNATIDMSLAPASN